MIERFDDRSRRTLGLAQDEARRAQSDVIDTDHLLLGLLDLEPDGPIAGTITAQGVNTVTVRGALPQPTSPVGGVPSATLPFSDGLKTVLESALRRSLQLGHDVVTSEHLLLGILDDSTGVAARTLSTAGADLSQLRQQVLDHLCARPGAAHATAPASFAGASPPSGHLPETVLRRDAASPPRSAPSPGHASPSPSPSPSPVADASPGPIPGAGPDGTRTDKQGASTSLAGAPELASGGGSHRGVSLPGVARRITGWGGSERSLSPRSMRAALVRYRVMAYVVGTLLSILCFVGLPLQFAAHNTVVVDVVGTIHGYCYLAYLAIAYDMARRVRWRIGRLVPVVLGGLVPGLAFVMERRITPQVRVDIDRAEAEQRALVAPLASPVAGPPGRVGPASEAGPGSGSRSDAAVARATR